MAKVLRVGSVFALAGAISPERQAQIKTINETPGVLWTAAAHPRFADHAPGANRRVYGVNGDWNQDVEEAISRGEVERVEAASNADIPESFDSVDNWPECAKVIGDIRDQSNCGCCWAFGGVTAASSRMCISSNATLQIPLSAQDVCFNSNFNGCGGGQITTPWSYIKGTGVVTGGQVDGTETFGSGWCSKFSLPHCHHHGPTAGDPYPEEGAAGCPDQSSPRGPKACDSDADAPHNNFASDAYSYSGTTVSARGVANIQQSIIDGGPVEVAFTVYTDFEDYAGGIYHHVTGFMAGGHAVMMVGWGVEDGEKYWKVANSWNKYWGENGYFRIRQGTNEGGMEDQGIAASPDATWGNGMATPEAVQV